MDALAFRKTAITVGWTKENFIGAEILINGKSLTALVYDIEKPQAMAEGRPDAADGYGEQVAEHLYRQLIGEYIVYEEKGIGLLTCAGCLEDGCRGFFGQVGEVGDEIIWNHFMTPHRAWDYSALGEFHFDKKQYNEELSRLRTFFQDE